MPASHAGTAHANRSPAGLWPASISPATRCTRWRTCKRGTHPEAVQTWRSRWPMGLRGCQTFCQGSIPPSTISIASKTASTSHAHWRPRHRRHHRLHLHILRRRMPQPPSTGSPSAFRSACAYSGWQFAQQSSGGASAGGKRRQPVPQPIAQHQRSSRSRLSRGRSLISIRTF